MARVWRMVAHCQEEGTTYAAAAGAMQTSPFTPDFNGRLVGLRALVSRTAATSLTDAVQYRLTCTTFNPNVIHVASIGTGLQTAPAQAAPIIDWSVDQLCQAGVPITIESRNSNASGVTQDNMLFGCFDVA